jgi:hypothetical protein
MCVCIYIYIYICVYNVQAQDRKTPLGAMLRIRVPTVDVKGGTPYTIPPGNPYAVGNAEGYLPEIYAYGYAYALQKATAYIASIHSFLLNVYAYTTSVYTLKATAFSYSFLLVICAYTLMGAYAPQMCYYSIHILAMSM